MAIICSLWQFQTLAASDSTQITLQPEGPDKGDKPDKGHRIPSAPIICMIDFEHNRILTSIPFEITDYELWEEVGDASIISYPSDCELVEYMAGITGVYMLRIVTSERAYVVYIEL